MVLVSRALCLILAIGLVSPIGAAFALPPGPPTINVNVVNRPDVSVLGTVPVEVIPDAPREVFHIGFARFTNEITSTINFDVPSGKLMVIENVTAHVDSAVQGLEWNLFGIRTEVGDVSVVHSIPLFRQSVYGFTAGQQVRLYHTTSSGPVIVYLSRTSGDAPYSWSASISGYLMPVNSPSLSP